MKENRLTIMTVHGEWAWCRCTCGNGKLVRIQNLKSGRSRSCGCLHTEAVSKGIQPKLTKRKIRLIRQLLKIGKTCGQIAIRFGVTPSTIYFIKAGKTWTDIR